MSHNDDIDLLPQEYQIVAKSQNGVIAAVCHKTRPHIGLQFHPEVHHTQDGKRLLEQFALHSCRLTPQRTTKTLCNTILHQIRQQISPKDKILLAISGGVDSSVTAALLTKALGPAQVHSVFVDHGMMRKNEVEIMSNRLRKWGLTIHVLSCKERFLSQLKEIADPEIKRKEIGKMFVSVFEAFAKERGGFTHLGQGTLYPDVIESARENASAQVIKSHHNVGGLLGRLTLQLIEPCRTLFKDEVRRIGKELELPHDILYRHPFPGPGLAVRIPGEITQEKIETLQEADDLFITALREASLYDAVWQAAAILLPIKSVGVMGDCRTYQWTCVLRVVTGVDGMTAEVAPLPMEFLTNVARKIVQNVAGINRVLYDITSKPPATIEWE